MSRISGLAGAMAKASTASSSVAIWQHFAGKPSEARQSRRHASEASSAR